MKKNLFLCLVPISVFLSVSLFAQQKVFQPTTIKKALYSDAIPSLLDMPVISMKPVINENDEETDEVKNELNLHALRNLTRNPFKYSQDPVLQGSVRDNMPIPMAPIQNFDGVSNTYGVYPPDTQGDVGPSNYVQVVNLGFQIFSKTGTSLYGPANLSTIWAGIPAPWNGTNNGDPIVLYDQAANRWMIAQFSLPNTTQYAMLIAVSQTSDPTGAWYRYVFQFGNKMPDYPKFGIWPDGYYMAVNQFISGSSWGGVGACAFERTKMLAGDPAASMIYFDLGATSDPGSMLPADWDGATAPVANEPNYFTYFNDWTPPTDDVLKIWNFHSDWTTPANSTFAESYSLVTAPFNSSLCSSGNCVPQSGSAVTLEALSDRLMYRLQYRNFGDHQSMVTNHTVNADGSGRAGVRWYELRNSGTGWSIYQQGTYSPDATHRWMGSVAMNANGDIALGYSASDATMFPSIRYTGRLAGDPLGQMTFAEQTIIAGSGYQSGSAARWGDYSMMSVDPTDDGTFWYTTEYIQTSGAVDWRTRIASFLFGPVVPTAQFSASTVKPCLNSTVIFTDQTGGIPTSWSWSVTPATYAYMDGTTSTSQNPHIKFTAFGTYTIALTATNAIGTNTITKTNYIAVNTVNADFTASPTTIVVGNSTTFTDASTCSISSWAWDFGAGASPATANTQGPHIVTYSTTGLKTVTLTLNGTVIQTKTNFITVTEPIFNMANGTITTCTGNFYDSGGSAGSYQNNENFTETFYPSTPGSMVRFIFNSFSTESGYDYLRIYNGTSTSATLIGTYNGTTGPGTVTASNASGALTFNFTSDVSVTSTGWSATISCYNTNVPPVADFSTSGTNPVVNTPVTFTDLSTNLPTSWLWTFSPSTITYLGATSATSQNPQVQFNAAGTYTVSLTATNAYGNNTMVKSGYINAINCTITAFPWLAGFENAGTIPSCWTQEYVTTPGLNWIFVAGNGSVNPATAHTGSYNACLKDNTSADNKTKLVSPPLDLTLTSSPVLKFWHTQAFWSPDQDILSVYYRTTAGGAWTLLTTYSSTITTWTEETITLPSPSATYYIGFEGNAKYGYGVCIDDVSVTGSSKTLNLTVFLEGLFNGTTMNKAQSAAGNQFPGAVADQVTVELHNSTSPYALAGGPYIVDVNTDGTASLTVPASLGASYYIVVKHRNSLETWNGSPVSFGAASMSYNFSSAAEQAFGSNLKLVSGKYVIFGGDVNQDGILDAADMTPMDNDASNFVNGYIATDANGDGIVNAGDVILLQNNASLFVAKIVP